MDQVSDALIDFVAAAGNIIEDIGAPSFPAQWVTHKKGKRNPADSDHTLQHASEEEDASMNLEPVARLFSFVLYHIKDIDPPIAGDERDSSIIIHPIFTLLRKVFDHIVHLGQSSSGTNPPTSSKSKTTRRSNGRFATSTSNSSEPSDVPPKQAQSLDARDPNILALANLFIHLLSEIAGGSGTSDEDHPWKAVTEGALNLIITRVASTLSKFVFGASAPILPFATPVQLPLLRGDDKERRIQESEAVWLLYLLEGCLPIMKPASRAARGTKTSAEVSDTRKRPTSTFVSTSMKKKLQDTLLATLFGSSAPQLKDILELPLHLDKPLDLSVPPAAFSGSKKGDDNKAEDTGEWFVGQVWRIVGWRLLNGWT